MDAGRTELRRGRRRLLALTTAIMVGGACSRSTSGPDDTTGPLAVYPGPPNGEEALIAGTLVITDQCVTLRDSVDQESLLTWSDEATRWDAESRTIRYRQGGRTIELADGDRVAFSGGFRDLSADGGTTPLWVTEPDPTCPTRAWAVGAYVDPGSIADP